MMHAMMKTILKTTQTLMLVFSVGAGYPVGSTTTLPNIIIIYADDLGYGDLSCYGAKEIKTPAVDKLAQSGLRFTNARCTAATCTPSRYSLLTGEYAWRKKGTNVLPGDARLIVPTDKITLGKLFQQAGYRTAVVGKWHLGLGPEGGPDWNAEVKPGPLEVGFDYSFIFPATADRVPTVYVRDHKIVALDPTDPIQVSYKEKIGAEPTGRENPELLKMPASSNHGHDGTINNGIGRIGWMTGGQRARWTDESLNNDFLAEAEAFIQQGRKRPFFLFMSLNDIHVPRMPGTPFKGKSGLGYRGDAMLQMDYTVERVMTQLDLLGLTENTMVIFTSDNGPVLDDGYVDGAVTELKGHNPRGPLRGGKYSILEAGSRIPWIIHWPARVKPGVSDALISQVDLVASFAALLGLLVPDGHASDSRNTMQVFLGESDNGRESVVVEGRALALIRKNWKYIAPYKGKPYMPLVDIETGYSTEPQLYDLSEDIGETRNLAAQYPDLVKELTAELERIKNRFQE